MSSLCLKISLSFRISVILLMVARSGWLWRILPEILLGGKLEWRWKAVMLITNYHESETVNSCQFLNSIIYSLFSIFLPKIKVQNGHSIPTLLWKYSLWYCLNYYSLKIKKYKVNGCHNLTCFWLNITRWDIDIHFKNVKSFLHIWSKVSHFKAVV